MTVGAHKLKVTCTNVPWVGCLHDFQFVYSEYKILQAVALFTTDYAYFEIQNVYITIKV